MSESVLPDGVHAAIGYIRETLKRLQEAPPSDLRTRAITELTRQLDVLASQAKTLRDELVIERADAGYSLRVIAGQVGMSHQQVGNIIKRQGGGKHARPEPDEAPQTRASLGFAAAPVPADYAPPPAGR